MPLDYHDDDFSPAIGTLQMEVRELRQTICSRAALVELAREQLREAYIALVQAEVTLKRARGVG